ncbi:MAG TPA: DUF2142 domain-containing protein [Chloroflexia bacterium]|nr:DUF2142 domain-containing protein [Chloroflexia bacterium]
MISSMQKHWPFLLTLALYLYCAVSYSLTVPAWEAPDEPAHFAYTHHIRISGGPPIQSFKEGQNEVETGHHPPLYYYIGNILTLPFNISDFSHIRTNPYFSFSNNDGGPNRMEHGNEAQLYPSTLTALHIMRLSSVLFGVGTLICIYASGLLVFGGTGWRWASGGRLPATVAAAWVGLLPQFAFLSGAANNDNLVIFFCCLTFWLCLRLALLSPQESKFHRPFFVWLGIVVGLGLLAKYNEVTFIPLVGLALAIAAWKRRDWRFFLWGALISGASCVGVAGWWFLRAQILYGDPAGWSMWRSSYNSIDQSKDFKLTGEFLAHSWERWFNSFWGYFGWFNLPFEPQLYKWLARFSALAGLSLLGLVLSLLAGYILAKRGRKLSLPGYDNRTGLGLLFVALTILFVGFSAFNYAVTFGDAGTQGRYLFPALPALALALSAGLCWLAGWLRYLSPESLDTKAGYAGLALGVVALFWLNQHALTDIIKPAYQTTAEVRPQVLLKELPPHAIKVTADNTFGPAMRLEGYSLEPSRREQIKAGKLKLTLYWRATKPTKENWVGFVHLVSGAQTFGQNDGPPCNGRYQTFKWQTGELIKDERELVLDDWRVRQIQMFPDAPLQLYLGWLRSPGGQKAKLSSGADAITLNWN